MYGMPLSQALVFLAAVIVLILATQWRHFHPFVALVVVAAVFGFVAGFPTSYLAARSSAPAFPKKIYSPGLVIVAAAFVGGLADGTRGADRLRAAIERWRWLGLASPRARGLSRASCRHRPLRRPPCTLAAASGRFAAARGKTRNGGTIALALGDFRKPRLLLLSPVPIAAAAILGAGWSRVALFGLPLAALARGFRRDLCQRLRWSSNGLAAAAASDQPSVAAEKQNGWPAIVLLLAVAIPLAAADGAIARRHSERAARRRTGARTVFLGIGPAADPLSGRRRHHDHRPAAAKL